MTTKCSKCKRQLQVGDWPFCPHGSVWASPNSTVAPPTVVFYNKKLDKYSFPARADAKPRPGYERVELSNFHQKAKFEKDMNRREHQRALDAYYQNRRNWDMTMKESREKLLERRGKASPTERGYIDLALKDMARRSEQMAYSIPHQDGAGFYIESFNQSRSNREGYSDERTGWKERRD